MCLSWLFYLYIQLFPVKCRLEFLNQLHLVHVRYVGLFQYSVVVTAFIYHRVSEVSLFDKLHVMVIKKSMSHQSSLVFYIITSINLLQVTVCMYWGADKSLAWPGRKQATATKLSLLQATQKKNSEGCPSNQVSAAAVTSASDEKWRPFIHFLSRVGLRTYQHPCIWMCVNITVCF